MSGLEGEAFWGITVDVITVIGGILLLWLTRQLARMRSEENKRKELAVLSDTPFRTSILRDKKVLDLVSELRVKLVASRTAVYQFHNGQFFSSKQPMWKTSMTHESCEPGVKYLTLEAQEVPAYHVIDTLLPAWGAKITGVTRIDKPVRAPTKGLYWYVVEKMPTGMTRQMLKSINLDCMMSALLVSPIDDQVIGAISIHYESARVPPGPTDMKMIYDAISEISYLLANCNPGKNCAICNNKKFCRKYKNYLKSL